MVQLFKEWEGKPCHLYKDKRRPWVDYTSVSTLKVFFAETFNSLQKAQSVSQNRYKPQYYGRSVQDILREWDEKREKGAAWGTRIHSHVEDYINSGFTYCGDTAESRNVVDIMRQVAEQNNYLGALKVSTEKATWIDICSLDRMWTRPIILERCKAGREIEVIKAIIDTGRYVGEAGVKHLHDVFKKNLDVFVDTACHYLLEVGAAGTIDIKIDVPAGFFIDDIKTDDNIDFVGFNGKRMTGPLSDLDDCSFEKYVMQVNLYGLMEQRRTGKRFLGGNIIWIKKDFSWEIIPIRNRQKQAGEALKVYFLTQHLTQPVEGVTQVAA